MFIKLGLRYWKLECQVKTLFFQTIYSHLYNSGVDFGVQKLISVSILDSMTDLPALYTDGSVFAF